MLWMAQLAKALPLAQQGRALVALPNDANSGLSTPVCGSQLNVSSARVWRPLLASLGTCTHMTNREP